MNMDITTLMLGALFGIAGWSAWRYGKQTASARHMILGVVLMAFPYFIPGLWPSLLVGAVLTVFLFWP